MKFTCSPRRTWGMPGRTRGIPIGSRIACRTTSSRHYKEALGTLAKRKNRPEGVAEAMADKNIQLFQVKNRRSGRVWYLTDAEIHDSNGEWEKGLPVPESGRNQLLTLNGVRAHELLMAESSRPRFRRLEAAAGHSAGNERGGGQADLGR